MRNIEYEVKLDDEGKPYIDLEKLNMDIEDSFFCFEIVKYRLFAMLNDQNNSFLPPEALEELALAGSTVQQLSNRFAMMIRESNGLMGDIGNILNKNDDDD